MTTQTAIECGRCGNALSEEEVENPRHDNEDGAKEGDPICDDCWHEQYEFTCCRCCEYGEVKDQHNMLVVFEECDSSGGDSRVVAPGVYKILNGPYFGGPIIGGGYLFGDQLERIADVNPDMDGEGYPCGHLCIGCQRLLLAQFQAKCSGCNQPSPSCLRVKLGSWKDFKASKYQWTRPKVLCAKCRHAHRGQWEISGGQNPRGRTQK